MTSAGGGGGGTREEGGEPEKSETRRKAFLSFCLPMHSSLPTPPTFEEPETLPIIMLISFRADFLQFTFPGYDVTGSKRILHRRGPN